MHARTLMVIAAALMLSACQSPGTAATPAASVAAVTPAPTVTPEPSPTPLPTPVTYDEVTKNADGAHGGAPLLDLPASLVIDYSVQGTCSFGVGFSTVTSDSGLPRLSVRVTGPEVTGTWAVTIPAGPYYVEIDEAVGCTFHVVVHAPA
jgi:uncharacterized protein YceK